MITVHWDSYKYIMQLSIYSEKFTCNELEKIFWLPVDNVFKKWDRYKDSNILYQKNEIRINYKWEYDDISIDKYFEYILFIIKWKELTFQEYKKDCEYQLSFVIYATNEPPLHFSSEILFQLWAFWIELDIDQYINKNSNDE